VKAYLRRRLAPSGWGGRPIENPALSLYVDGFCSDCRAAGRLLARLDLTDRVEICSFRHNHSYAGFGIAAAALEQRMHTVERTSRQVHSGFGAVQALARRMPLLWPLVPILALLRRQGRGEQAYDWLAARRRIIPDPAVCQDRCERPLEADAIPRSAMNAETVQ